MTIRDVEGVLVIDLALITSASQGEEAYALKMITRSIPHSEPNAYTTTLIEQSSRMAMTTNLCQSTSFSFRQSERMHTGPLELVGDSNRFACRR